jgi:hypothetical protein
LREHVNVTYELNLINREGEEFTETFSHCFDSEIYEIDVEGTDITMVNFKVQDLKSKYGEIFLMDFAITREGVCH